ncbi:MAG: hypothetical protein OHK0013_45560 [Sandaracinaceae bacterium]
MTPSVTVFPTAIPALTPIRYACPVFRVGSLGALVLLLSVLLAVTSRAAAQGGDDTLAPLSRHGCTACHSLDGSERQGPTFVGLAGSHRGVYRDGERVTVIADAAYLRRAIEAPDAEIAEGFVPGYMPRIRLEAAEIDALVAAIAAVPAEATPASGDWVPLALGLFFFVLGHLALSSAPFRGWIVARLGAGGFAGLYSLVAALSLAAIVWGWGRAPYVVLFEPPTWARWIPNVLMPIAIVFMVLGFTTPSATAAGQEQRAAEGPRGIHRITRHPSLWGFGLWGLSHLGPNGDLRSSLVFVGIAFLSFAGMVHIDLRRAASGGEAWERYERATSVFPFVAILARRQKLVLGELGWWRVLLALVVWGASLHFHRALLGVSALP